MGRVYLLQSIILFVFLAIFVSGEDFGSPCNQDLDCVKNGICQVKGSIKVCACQKGFRKNGTVCTALTTCDVNRCRSEKDKNATCGINGCQCSNNYYSYAGYCTKATGCDDSSCTREGDTQAVANVRRPFFVRKTPAYKENKDRCVKDVGIPCYDDDECVLNGFCKKNGTSSVCACKIGVPSDNKCALETEEQCEARCRLSGDSAASCDVKRNCICSQKDKYMDGSCLGETDDECQTRCGNAIDNDVKCDDGKCLCSHGYILMEETCVKETDDDCLARCGKAINPDVNCSENGNCLCSSGFRIIDGACRRVLDSPCISSLDCSPFVPNSDCLTKDGNRICNCSEGFRPKHNMCKFIKVRHPVTSSAAPTEEWIDYDAMEVTDEPEKEDHGRWPTWLLCLLVVVGGSLGAGIVYSVFLYVLWKKYKAPLRNH